MQPAHSCPQEAPKGTLTPDPAAIPPARGPRLLVEHSRSSSKWVSIPSSPGTEQMSRAFRNVLHLLTRQQWPPSSFWGWGQAARLDQLIHPKTGWSRSGERQQGLTGTYEADAPDAGVHGGVLRSLGGALPEEEVELVVIALRTVRDELSVNE